MFKTVARAVVVSVMMSCTSQATPDPSIVDPERLRQCAFPITYKIANNVQALYYKPIQDGIEYWNYVLGQQIFVFGGFFTAGFESTDEFLPVYLTYFPLNGICGVTSFKVDDAETACMSKTRIDLVAHSLVTCVMWGKLESVVRHEAAHALGLEHTEEPGFLMSPSLDHTQEHPMEATSWEILKLREKVEATLDCQ